MDYAGLDGDINRQSRNLLKKAFEDPKWLENAIISFIQFQMRRVSRNEIVPTTISNYIKSLKTFLEMNDFLTGINWRKIKRGLPLRKDAADDRPPTKEEIKKLEEYPDRRIKVIVLIMLSSGIRVGAWDYLNWKHVKACYDNNNRIIAARLLVYAGEPEQYITFMTPEAYKALSEWMDFRASFGEKISGDSPLMRDSWQTTNVNQRQRLGLATHAQRLKSSGVKRLLERALWEQGIRQPLKNGQKRHEWKAAHGFRKYYETTANTAMRSINVAWTMGHSIGISESYYKPTENEVLRDYLNAVPKLIINDQSELLNEELVELRQSTEDNSYVLKAKFEEKDKEIAQLIEKVNKLESDHNSWLDVIAIAKKIAKDENGVFDKENSILDAERKFTIAYTDKNNQTKTMRIPIDLVEVLDGDPEQYIKSPN
jgi:hypothetical protein